MAGLLAGRGKNSPPADRPRSGADPCLHGRSAVPEVREGHNGRLLRLKSRVGVRVHCTSGVSPGWVGPTLTTPSVLNVHLAARPEPGCTFAPSLDAARTVPSLPAQRG